MGKDSETNTVSSQSKIALLLSQKNVIVDNETKSVDKFAIVDDDIDDEEANSEPSWEDLTTPKKAAHVCKNVLKLFLVLILLYFFICALDLLSIGFRIIGGSNPEKLLRLGVLDNYVVGLMCGILFTVLVQSSSTTSSTVVGLVAGKILPIRTAIPIIMGANIGTSVTNTLLAMVQVADREKFRLAFAAATVHDMFNWLTTIVLLPIESATGYLYYTTSFLVQEISDAERSNKTKNLKLLKELTEPLTKTIVKLDKKTSSVKKSAQGHIFTDSTWGDGAIGGVIIGTSFFMLMLCLFWLIYILKSTLKGKIAVWIRRVSNSNLPHCPKMTDYLLMMMGALLTFIVQSSSAFTSTLPPLVAVKALSLERAYTLTLGANIGTTTTALIASLTQTEGQNFTEGLQIALCHLVFNITGMLMFFPVPCTRFPIRLAKALGNTTAQYRWFAIVYILFFFILIPVLFMTLAFAGSIYVICMAIFMIGGFLFVYCINSLKIYPRFLPKIFHSWNWLPEWLRSLEPYDRIFAKRKLCDRLIKLARKEEPTDKNENLAAESDNPKQSQSETPVLQQKSKNNLANTQKSPDSSNLI